jgi:RNA polymerase sigma-70 factor (ECF subfamily)
MEQSETYLINEIMEGDKDAYAVLVRRYQKPMFNLMMRMTSNSEDAFDLTQETFVRAYEKLDHFNPSNRFFPWLYTIGLNLARDFLRKERIRESHNNEVRKTHQTRYLEMNPDPIAPNMERLELQQVQEALATLPLESREAVMLRFHEDMPMKEVAQALGISISGAKMRVHRALLRLREILYQKESGSPDIPEKVTQWKKQIP